MKATNSGSLTRVGLMDKHYVVRAEEILTAFLGLEMAIQRDKVAGRKGCRTLSDSPKVQ
jgi:hypothetical protein